MRVVVSLSQLLAARCRGRTSLPLETARCGRDYQAADFPRSIESVSAKLPSAGRGYAPSCLAFSHVNRCRGIFPVCFFCLLNAQP